MTLHEIYMKTCVDFIMKNNCPDPLICGINCATDKEIVRNEMKIVPFNNHGVNYLRIRTCLFKVHSVSGYYVDVNDESVDKSGDDDGGDRFVDYIADDNVESIDGLSQCNYFISTATKYFYNDDNVYIFSTFFFFFFVVAFDDRICIQYIRQSNRELAR